MHPTQEEEGQLLSKGPEARILEEEEAESDSLSLTAEFAKALAKGKNTADKRQTIKDRDWKREQGRILRDRG